MRRRRRRYRRAASGATAIGVTVLALAALARPAAPRDEAPPPASVVPGGVVRWAGEGIERCAMAGRRWPPLAGACWYPIDLLARPGGLEIARWRGGSLETRRLEIADYPYEVQHITLDDDSQVNLSAADLRRVRAENARIGRLWSRGGPPRFSLPLQAPLRELPAGGRFGARRFFNDQPRSPHSGADYPAPEGEPVYAAAAGVVALAGDFFFSGRSVFLDHGDGLITMYFHLSEIAVEEGAAVERGSPIGAVGQSGRATGPHLHFGARWRRARVDPTLLLGPLEAVPTLE